MRNIGPFNNKVESQAFVEKVILFVLSTKGKNHELISLPQKAKVLSTSLTNFSLTKLSDTLVTWEESLKYGVKNNVYLSSHSIIDLFEVDKTVAMLLVINSDWADIDTIKRLLMLCSKERRQHSSEN